MKSLITICMAMVGLGAAAPAFAQHISPTGTTVIMTGPASVNSFPCTLTIGVNIDAAGTRGTTTAGSNTGSGVCPFTTIDAGAIVTTSGWNASTGTLTGTISGVVIRFAGNVACTGTLPFAVKNTPPPPATPTGSVTTIIASIGCGITMSLSSPLIGSM